MAQIGAIFSRHCHRPIIFYFSTSTTCVTFFARASGAVALKVAQVPMQHWTRWRSMVHWYTVSKTIDFPRYSRTRNVVGKYYTKYFVQYLFFLYTSCYISDILITFLTV